MSTLKKRNIELKEAIYTILDADIVGLRNYLTMANIPEANIPEINIPAPSEMNMWR